MVLDFITEQEEAALVKSLLADPNWKQSQSGRRKIDYGPQVNFKKRKVKSENFKGLPLYMKPCLERVAALDKFEAHEVNVLEY